MIAWGMGRLGEFSAKLFGADDEFARLFGLNCAGLTALATGDIIGLGGYQSDLFSRDGAQANKPLAKAINRAVNTVYIVAGATGGLDAVLNDAAGDLPTQAA